MATVRCFSLSTSMSQCPRPHHQLSPGTLSHQRIPLYHHSSFRGTSFNLSFPKKLHLKIPKSQSPSKVTMMAKPSIQFIVGTDEQTIPDIRLTKSRDGTNGVAIFTFSEPSVFDSSRELGDITGFYMIDEEGTIQSVDVSAKFVNGKPAAVEAKHIMRTPKDWDRFMRFMERYSEANGLQFIKK